MFLSANIFLLKLLILFGLTLSVLGDCGIHIPKDPAVVPILSIYVGSHKLKLNTNKYRDNLIMLHGDQKLEADCDINFELPENFKTSNKIYIKCESNSLYMSSDIQHRINNNYYYRPTLQCSLLRWQLYESFPNFEWCPSNATSYILARPKSWDLTIPLYNYLAGICYDIYNNSFHSLYYTIAPNKIKNTQPQILRDLYVPVFKIDYIEETFGTNSLPLHLRRNYDAMNWLTNFNYEFNTIIPPHHLNISPNDKFSTLIEFVWWSNLRLYNWKSYTRALERHVEKDNESYDVLAGVSGVLKVPTLTPCQTNYTMKEVVFDTNRNIPLYVWNYLQSRSNSTNEIVIIGFNSPFNEFYAQRDITFCVDRCQEIPWLKDASATFQYKIMGYVICCSVEDVRSSKVLHGFPEHDINPKSVETTQLTTSYDEESTEINYNENYI